jgi:hypothetical protein
VPSNSQHVAQADRNEKLAAYLMEESPDSGYAGWAITALFYAALHLVDAHLAIEGFHPESHAVRDNYVAFWPTLKPIFEHYRELKQRSEDSRYRCIIFDRQFARTMWTKQFTPLKSHLQTPPHTTT